MNSHIVFCSALKIGFMHCHISYMDGMDFVFFFVFCFLDLIILIVVHDDVEVTYYTGFHVDLQILYISF